MSLALRWVLFFCALSSVPVGAALVRVWLRQEAVAQGYLLSRAQQQREALRAQIRKLELEHAAGRTPVRLQRMATALGLVPATPDQIEGPRRARQPQKAERREGPHGRR